MCLITSVMVGNISYSVVSICIVPAKPCTCVHQTFFDTIMWGKQALCILYACSLLPQHTQGHDIWLMKVEGITNPEAAGTLRNHRLYMLLSDCTEEVNDDEFYPWELVGMQVRTCCCFLLAICLQAICAHRRLLWACLPP